MLGIVSLTSQDAEGNLLKDGSDPKSVWMSNLYDINEKLLLDIYLVPIFQRLINEGTIDAKILIDYINKKGVFGEEFITVWTTAIERFFAKDYISFLHVLIPRFESFFLDITSGISKNQIDTITARNQKNKKDDIWIQDKTLSEDFLRRSDVLKLWGKDLCEHINYLFFSQLGLKLRHELAHGRLEVKNANFTNSILVLYLFLIIISNFKQTDK